MPATMTDGGFPIRCEICGASSSVDVSRPPGDSVCPVCGSFLWVDALAELLGESGFVPDLRLPNVAALTRTEAIYEIVAELARENGWTESESRQLTCGILARESLGTTGIGRGVAFPHAWVDWLDRCVTAMAYLPYSVDFNAADGRPVHTIVLIASPEYRKAEALRVIEQVARGMCQVGAS